MAGKIPVPNFDPARIPQTTDEVNFHADATYVFERMAADIIPDFNHNFDWFEGALTGDLTSLVDSMTAYKAALTSLGDRNKIVNGQFNIDQRGKGGAGYTANIYTLDRWKLDPRTGTSSIKQGTFALGQTDVPGNPKHFVIWERSEAGSNAAFFFQKIEDVSTLSGQAVTATLWVKATAATQLRLRITQEFGTGGSPSTAVIVSSNEIAVTTSWQKASFTFDIPSISGKTLGTNGDDYLEFTFDRDHDDTNATATVHIANVSLVEGDATAEADPGAWRVQSIELLMCQRYYWRDNSSYIKGYVETAGESFSWSFALPVEMRVVPTVAFGSATFNDNLTSITPAFTTRKNINLAVVGTAAGTVQTNERSFEADAEL